MWDVDFEVWVYGSKVAGVAVRGRGDEIKGECRADAIKDPFISVRVVDEDVGARGGAAAFVCVDICGVVLVFDLKFERARSRV